jgi:thiamine biosynthesis lipoprotein
MEIYGVSAAEGDRFGTLCERTIRELEQAFSLYQENSELSILNRERHLARPSALFRRLLGSAVDLSARTGGFYQPAVHGAWLWLEENTAAAGLEGNPGWIEQCAASDLRFLETASDGSLRLTHPLTQLSMNAIGQGFLADTVAALLRAEGVTSALLHLGESYAIGRHPEGRLWKLALQRNVQIPNLVVRFDGGPLRGG